MYKMIIY